MRHKRQTPASRTPGCVLPSLQTRGSSVNRAATPLPRRHTFPTTSSATTSATHSVTHFPTQISEPKTGQATTFSVYVRYHARSESACSGKKEPEQEELGESNM